MRQKAQIFLGSKFQGFCWFSLGKEKVNRGFLVFQWVLILSITKKTTEMRFFCLKDERVRHLTLRKKMHFQENA